METLAAAAKTLALPLEGEEADWLGRLSKIIRDLNGLKRAVLDELAGPATGVDYQITESRSAKRSYNTAGLLAVFADQGWDLHDLRRVDAVRLSWRWSELNRAIHQAGVTVTIAPHEVEDEGEVDGAQIGEVWTSRYQVEGA